MHIGLVGGIGPAATDYYYQRIIRSARERGADLDLTMVHADTSTLVRNLLARDEDAQVEIYVRLTSRLLAAGADIVAITSIAGHFCVDAFEPLSPLPVSNIVAAVDRAVAEAGFRRVGILGTRTAMETRLYGGITSAEVVPPEGEALIEVDRAYIDMASAGFATQAQRDVLLSAGRTLYQAGADAVLLAGTDLVLAVSGPAVDFEVVDCAAVHADHLSQLAGHTST
jgi:aspartate racemase